MLVGKRTPESKRQFRKRWRSYKGPERKMWSPSSRQHSHADESVMRSLAMCLGWNPPTPTRISESLEASVKIVCHPIQMFTIKKKKLDINIGIAF
ncbi:hypothetical protein EVAR_55310_1 [Eumeta japonica]|uniref:Uncharacterized protein n=1 Tax=Eumeta variegata TaxID=151549 RepID=A0A4C1Z7P7_EUMVA|nr:hypothetical protein EVAR_55310_1 [Eumeta japonica]